MRWMLLVCVVASACAAGAEMRPRGRRNSTRIDELDQRISAVEGQSMTVRSGALSPRLTTLEAEVAQLKKTVELLQAQVRANEASPSPAAPAPAVP